MKNIDEHYTVIIFRGARSTPLRVKIRPKILRRVLITLACVTIVQFGIVAHYIIQWNQLAELHALKAELSQSRARTSSFAGEIEGMRKRMVALETLNRKLQTLFGLEPDSIESSLDRLEGQGGEEFPFEVEGMNLSLGLAGENGTHIEKGGSNETYPLSRSETLIASIEKGLEWLEHQSNVEETILNELSEIATQRAKQWAATPSIWPVKGPITSKFGPRISPFTGKKAMHAGIDIGAPTGTPVQAPANGKVVVAAYDTRMGKFVRIDHGYGVETTYGHLSKILVKYGQKVRRGDIIGHVGSTGKFSTGPHLHYQIAVNDRVVNPVQYILD
ncbi:MAG: M23 family metallopeptidase [Nitrospirae bacterium]|nr:MAG: M23 family metallopeptidase [Nitrospirota bacterium]